MDAVTPAQNRTTKNVLTSGTSLTVTSSGSLKKALCSLSANLGTTRVCHSDISCDVWVRPSPLGQAAAIASIILEPPHESCL